MNTIFQLLSAQDLPSLLEMMREFYHDQHMRFAEPVARAGLDRLMADRALGQVCLIYFGSELVGYFVLTFAFSLEFHGKFGLLDELYIRPAWRGRKLGKSVIAFAESLCRQAGVKALRLEVGRENAKAQALYQACGFTEDPRHLFTKWL